MVWKSIHLILPTRAVPAYARVYVFTALYSVALGTIQNFIRFIASLSECVSDVLINADNQWVVLITMVLSSIRLGLYSIL